MVTVICRKENKSSVDLLLKCPNGRTRWNMLTLYIWIKVQLQSEKSTQGAENGNFEIYQHIPSLWLCWKCELIIEYTRAIRFKLCQSAHQLDYIVQSQDFCILLHPLFQRNNFRLERQMTLFHLDGGTLSAPQTTRCSRACTERTCSPR